MKSRYAFLAVRWLLIFLGELIESYTSNYSVEIDIVSLKFNMSLFSACPHKLAFGNTIIGSNISMEFQSENDQRLYLNTERNATCNGTITTINYCYYGTSDSNPRIYQSLVAVYRPTSDGRDFEIVSPSIRIQRQTTGSTSDQSSSDDILLPGFNCDAYQLEESIPVQIGDVIGACIDEIQGTRRLNMVSRTDEDERYNNNILLNIGADNAGCSDGALPTEIMHDDLSEIRRRILHVFSEISKIYYL